MADQAHLRAIIVEDTLDDYNLVVHILRARWAVAALRVDAYGTMRAALEIANARREYFDVILCDYVLPQLPWPQALDLAKELHCGVPFIIVSGALEDDKGLEALRLGAADFLEKRDLRRLNHVVQRELVQAQIHNANYAAAQALARRLPPAEGA